MNSPQCAAAATILAAAGLAWPAAAAESSGFYLGASWGVTTFNHDVATFNDGSLSGGRVDDGDSGWKLFAGYNVNRYFAAEGGFTRLNNDVDSLTTYHGGFSDGSGSEYAEGGVGVDVHKPDVWFLSAMGMLPVSERLVLCGKVGVQSWRTEFTIFDSAGIREEDRTGTDPLVGLGAAYGVSKRLALRLEWERFMDIAGDDIDLASLGLTVKLGAK